MIATALTDMFELQHPILLGSMGAVSGGRLAAAVSVTGGRRQRASVARRHQFSEENLNGKN
ncbi:MAG: hypothetical protein HY848_10320 [Betaproteobacteria bacterium]|nr:hypothetical protein [Betaproteobacteria bacterium]